MVERAIILYGKGVNMKYKITAQRLRDALHSKGLKAQELANLAQINKASVSHYLGGSHKPSNINAGKMAQVLGVDPLYLMGFDVPPKGKDRYCRTTQIRDNQDRQICF